MGNTNPSVGTAIGLLVAIVAVLGSQFLGWEWGAGQTIPTILGVVVACLAVVLVTREKLA